MRPESDISSQNQTSAMLKNETDGLLTRKAAARMLGVKEQTIDRWARQGDFNTYRHRGEVRFLKSELIAVWKAV